MLSVNAWTVLNSSELYVGESRSARCSTSPIGLLLIDTVMALTFTLTTRSDCQWLASSRLVLSHNKTGFLLCLTYTDKTQEVILIPDTERHNHQQIDVRDLMCHNSVGFVTVESC